VKLLNQKAVAQIVGCSTRGACAVIKAIAPVELGTAAEQLSVDEVDLLAWLTKMARARPIARVKRERVAYFIDDGQAVKIGESTKVGKRFEDLQKANSRRLTLVAAFRGGPAAEAYYHGRFREHHIHGEWFQRAGTLDAFLSGLR
jgi:hypothetical protein